MHRRPLSITLILCATLAICTSCGEEQSPINQVEAYALPKSLFTGEWYYHQAVVDTPAASSVAFEHFKGQTYRIRWDIQQAYLYARMSYEQVQGAKKISQDTGEYLGEIVGAWRIKSHFDIKRAYNATTGEESNILMENPLDCNWYDCKYIRVDWSMNLATDQNFLYFNYPAIHKQPIPFSEQDASDPRYKPIFDGEGGYIDVTSALAIAPGTFNWWGMSIPLCWLLSGQDSNCTTEVVKVRNSFWRRDPNRDYEPRSYRGPIDEMFGIFVNERWNYHSEQGLSYWAKQHYMNRHNIWAKHHADKACNSDQDCTDVGDTSRCDMELDFHRYDVTTDGDADGLPDAYEETVNGLSADRADSDGDGLPDAKDDADGNGTRNLEDFWKWDSDAMEHRCTLPLNQRAPTPMVFFNTGFFPKSLVCDEYGNDPAHDSKTGPCEPWKWSGDEKVYEQNWSVLHRAHEAYSEVFWRIFLRGVHNWSDADYKKWLTTHDPNQFSEGQRNVLGLFGDAENGYYSFAICPNNPLTERDPWPCRFPRHSFAQAKELMGQGLKFNHLSYAQAKQRLDRGKKLDQAPPYIRKGDIRYSLLHYIDQYSPYQFLGVAQWSSDPRTGEILSGYANVSSALDFSTTRVQEYIDLLNGRIKPTDMVNGVNLDQWVSKVNQQASGAKPFQRVINQAQLNSMYQAMEQRWMKQIPRLGTSADFEKMTDDKGVPLTNRQLKRKLYATLAGSGLFDSATTKADLSAIRGTPLEKRMIDNELLTAANLPPQMVQTMTELTDEILDQTSLARGGLLARMEARTEFMRMLTEDLHMDLQEMVDDGLTALAARMKGEQPEGLWRKLRKLIGTHVVMHEMGHTVGLYHNFGGSEDAVNFPEEYWRLRTNDYKDIALCNSANPGEGQLCPFFLRSKSNFQLGLDAKNQQTGLKSLNEYATTTVMEYARFASAAQPMKMGSYDHAALMFAHGEKLEVFKDPGKVPWGVSNGQVDPYQPNLFQEWYESNGSVLMLYSNRAQSFHYTQWYPTMGRALFDPANRELVNFREVKEVADPTSGRSAGWYHVNGNTLRVRVPYVYCKSTSQDIGDNCLSHDEGADQYERMRTFIDAWDTWYVLGSFPRGRYYWSPWTYYWRKLDQFYSRLKDFNNGFAFYQGLFHQWYDQAQINEFFADPLNGYGPYTVAVNDAFNVALRTIAMPDITYFDNKTTMPDGHVVFPKSAFTTGFSTDLTNGRYFSTSYYDTNYEQDCGYFWRECLHHIGFYVDKIMSMFVISDPRTYFVGQDTAEDIRRYRISHFDNFTDQIIDFFGAMLSHDHDAISPFYNPGLPANQTVIDNKGNRWVNRVAWRDYVDPSLGPDKPASGGAIESGTNFTLQLYAAVLGMFRFQGNFDNEFVERGRMWKAGKGTQWDIDPLSSDMISGKATFVDPFNGSTYEAIAYTDGRGIAQRMIARANALKARTQYCGSNCTGSGDPYAAEAALQEYKDLLDLMVQVTSIYDTLGHNWNNDPFNP